MAPDIYDGTGSGRRPMTEEQKSLLEYLLLNLSSDEWIIMHHAGEIAARMGYRVYAVGGMVRDLLLRAGNLDVDLAVEGDGIALAEALAAVHGARVRGHRRFGTAEVLFPNGFKVDVATTRVEFYEFPAALPRVKRSSLRQDLNRRDFTINAMAVDLNGDDFGNLVDYFGGWEDLKHGLVRVLSNLSFIEDPTRLLRAVRFEQRYNFKIEPQTLILVQDAVNRKVLDRVSNERIWDELKHILMEPKAGKMLARLDELDIWPFVFPGVSYWEVQPVLQELDQSLAKLEDWGLEPPGKQWLCYLIAALHCTDPRVARSLCGRYHLNKRQTEKVLVTLKNWRSVKSQIWRMAEQGRNSELARTVLALPHEAHPLLFTLLDGEWLRERFRQLLLTIRKTKPTVDGKYIKSLGYYPGPIFRQALDALWQAELDGQVKTSAEEKAFIEEFLRRHQEEESRV